MKQTGRPRIPMPHVRSLEQPRRSIQMVMPLHQGTGFVTLALLLGVSSVGVARAEEERVGVANFSTTATVTANSSQQSSSTKGSVRFRFPSGSTPVLEELQFTAHGVVLSGSGADTVKSGVLSFRATSTDSLDLLGNGSFRGTLRGTLHFPLIDHVLGFGSVNPDGAVAEAFVSRAYLMAGTIQGQFASYPVGSSLSTIPVDLTIQMTPVYAPLPFNVAMRVPFGKLNLMLNRFGCLGRQICIQPVGIRSNSSDATPTGTAYETLMDAARDIWSRVCIGFEERPFKYVENAAFKVMTFGSLEATELRATVNDDDCIEVFFIERWTNPEACGAGVTWSIGESSAQVVTSDQNDNGIDFHHLAHEIGHVLDLTHPGTGCPSSDCPNSVDGTEGTVACPSGYERDNPDVMSSENRSSANNPLMIYTFIDGSRSPDCTDSTDCGACP